MDFYALMGKQVQRFSNISRVKQFSIQALLLLFLRVFKGTNLHKNPQPGDNRLWNSQIY